MQIPMQLPQFYNQNVLFVVMGSQRGILYFASDGTMEIIGTVEQPTPRYSDREGYFARSGHGYRYGGGSAYEENNVEQIRRFFRKAANEVYRVMRTHDIDHVYVYEPAYAKGAVTMTLKPLVDDRVELVRYGNYIHAAPTTLLGLLQQAHDVEIDPADPASVGDEENADEKRSVLAHAAQAREVIRG